MSYHRTMCQMLVALISWCGHVYGDGAARSASATSASSVLIARDEGLATAQSRPIPTDGALREWLQNMLWYHHFSPDEVEAATGIATDELPTVLQRLQIEPRPAKLPLPTERLRVLPYPGGRHPRIGFLEGAIQPQRETKVSVFAPWSAQDYVVADVPEAIWSNLGLTYLAHTHVPTVWTQSGVTLPPLEWQAEADGRLSSERTLPNGIRFGTRVVPQRDHVLMEMWLFNGTSSTLTDLRVQNCVLLKGLSGFADQTNDNKLFRSPYAACHDAAGTKWVITAWSPAHRVWGNERCPCLHADPKFPDCAPGQTQRLRGWLSFYAGTHIDEELARIDALNWQTPY